MTLLARGQVALDGPRQSAAEHAPVAGPELLLHVHQRDAGERRLLGVRRTGPGANPVGQQPQADLAAQAHVVGANVRGRAAHHQRRAAQLAQLQGHVAGVVAGADVGLLVVPVVLLVDHHEPQVRLGGEQRAARADHHVVFAAPDAPPLVEALAGSEAAVEHSDAPREPGREALDGLVGEGDLRHERDGPLAEAAALLHRVEVDLGLAAAGHALEQEGPRIEHGAGPGRRGLVGEGGANLLRDPFLFRCKHGRRDGLEASAGQRVALERRLLLSPPSPSRPAC